MDEKTVQELEQELAALQYEWDEISKMRNALESRLTEAKERLRQLRDPMSGKGEISYKKAKIERAKLIAENSKKPRVIWSDGTVSETHVVQKVTKKQIYVCPLSGGRSQQYHRSTGKPVSDWPTDTTIDIKAMGISPT